MYWEKKGEANTAATAEAALRRAKELGIKQMVIASSSGRSVEEFLRRDDARGIELICVTHHCGFMAPGELEMKDAKREELTGKGVKILTTTHLLGGVDRAVRNKFGGVYPAELIAQSLRMLGQGVKVCAEISVMALDAGLIDYGQEIVAVAGSGTGADTAVVITPAHSNSFFDTKIQEIICKPREC